MAGESRYVTRAEFARLRNCSGPYVTKLGHQGRLVLDASGKLVDVAATIALLERTDDPARGGDRTGKPAAAPTLALPAPGQVAPATQPAPGVVGDSAPVPAEEGTAYKTAATRERIAKARLAELELAEKSGNLVRRDEVEAAVFGLARQAQEALDAIADRLSTQLAAETDPARVHQLLSDDLRRVMQQLAAARPLPPLPAQAPVQEAA
jgi:phage terminase Nu1 subunit (DNA packaging protein)